MAGRGPGHPLFRAVCDVLFRLRPVCV